MKLNYKQLMVVLLDDVREELQDIELTLEVLYPQDREERKELLRRKEEIMFLARHRARAGFGPGYGGELRIAMNRFKTRYQLW